MKSNRRRGPPLPPGRSRCPGAARLSLLNHGLRGRHRRDVSTTAWSHRLIFDCAQVAAWTSWRATTPRASGVIQAKAGDRAERHRRLGRLQRQLATCGPKPTHVVRDRAGRSPLCRNQFLGASFAPDSADFHTGAKEASPSRRALLLTVRITVPARPARRARARPGVAAARRPDVPVARAPRADDDREPVEPAK